MLNEFGFGHAIDDVGSTGRWRRLSVELRVYRRKEKWRRL